MCGFEFDAETELLWLRDEMLAQTYLPGPYWSFYVLEAKHRFVSRQGARA